MFRRIFKRSKVIKPNKFAILSVFFLLGLLGLFALYLAFTWYFPIKFWDEIEKNAKKYNLEPAFICGVIHAESKFQENALSHKNATGLMQLTEGTAYWALEETGLLEEMNIDEEDIEKVNLNSPKINIELGSWYLRKLLNQYDENIDLALSAYNAGSGNVAKWLQNNEYSKDGKTLYYIPFEETRNYLKRVNFSTKIYEFLIKYK